MKDAKKGTNKDRGKATDKEVEAAGSDVSIQEPEAVEDKPKPKPSGEIPVWSEARLLLMPHCQPNTDCFVQSRQALCEALPYYRAYQSGPYHTDGVCRGSLLDKAGGDRDYLGAEVAITRVYVYLATGRVMLNRL